MEQQGHLLSLLGTSIQTHISHETSNMPLSLNRKENQIDKVSKPQTKISGENQYLNQTVRTKIFC